MADSETDKLNRAEVERMLADARKVRGAYAILAVEPNGSERLVEVAGFHTADEAAAIAASWQSSNWVEGRKFRARPATPQEVESRSTKKGS